MTMSALTQLRKKYDNRCHYCEVETVRTIGHPRQGTKEHVVPRAFGGANDINNYVLACSDCNNKRGTILHFCKCEDCTSKIQAALESDAFIEKMFSGIIKHNKPRVLYYAHHQQWAARCGHARRLFDTWDEAMVYALNGTFRRGE